jgi:tetratricopeptide (TPR) repeat protein
LHGGPWAFAAMNRLAGVVDRLAQELKAVPSAGALVVQLQNQAHAARVKAYSQLEKNEVLSPAVVELSSQLVRFAQGPRGGFRIAGVSPQATEETLSQIRSRLTQNSKNSGAWVDYGNVLWGQGKSRLAELAFDYALSLNPKEASALNNRAAMILLSGGGEEDWIEANRANELLKKALQVDSFLVAAQVNRASLLNYYHVFAPAKKLWNQVLARSASPEAWDGLAVAQLGLGERGDFAKAESLGADSDRFASAFHQAASRSIESGKKCLGRLDDLPGDRLNGFEKEAAMRLRRFCEGKGN